MRRLQQVDVGPGLPVVTAWQQPQPWWMPWRRQARHAAFGCPCCRRWSEVPTTYLGRELSCPDCGRALKLNPFAIHGDWRSVAARWE